MLDKIVCFIIIIILIALDYFFYRMNEKFIREGKYWKPIYSGKITVWGIPFYFTSIFIMILLFALFGD